MPNRYYTQDARLSGPLEFLAGFGQQRNQVHAQEAQMDFQNEMAGRQALTQATGSFANMMQGIGQQRRQGQQATALQTQRGQQRSEFQAQGAANRLRELGEQAFVDRFGSPPDPFGGPSQQAPPGLQGAPPIPLISVGQPGSSVVGPPAPMQQQQAPPPPQPGGMPSPSHNPATTTEYRNAQKRYDALVLEGNDIRRSPNLSVEEQTNQLAAITPEISQLRQTMARTQPPKPPATFQEMVQAGANNGGLTPIPGTSNFIYQDGNGALKVSTAVHPEVSKSWVDIEDESERNKIKRQDLEDNHVGPIDPDAEYLFNGKEWKKQKEEKEFDVGEYISKRVAQTDPRTGRSVSATEAMSEAVVIQDQIAISEAKEHTEREAADLREKYGHIHSGEQLYEALTKDDPKFFEAARMFMQPGNFVDVSGEQLEAAGAYLIGKLMRMRNAGALTPAARRDLEPLIAAVLSGSPNREPLPLTLQP